MTTTMPSSGVGVNRLQPRADREKDLENRVPVWSPALHHSTSFFMFVLLHPTGLLRQQLSKFQVRLPKLVDLLRVDVIADERAHLRMPIVSLRLVLADVVREQRLVFGLIRRSLA